MFSGFFYVKPEGIIEKVVVVVVVVDWFLNGSLNL